MSAEIRMKVTGYATDFGLLPMDAHERLTLINPRITGEKEAAYNMYVFYQNNMSRAFYLDILSRLLSDKNYVIQIFGPPGSGKSKAARWIAYFTSCIKGKPTVVKQNRTDLLRALMEMVRESGVDPKAWRNLTVEEVEAVRKHVAGTVAILDEQDKKRVGRGSDTEFKAISDIITTVRAFQICFITVTAEVKDYPHDYILQALREYDESTGKAKLLVYYDKDKPPQGFVITMNAKEGQAEYDLNKARNIIRVLAGEGTGRTADLKRRAKEIVDNPLFQAANTVGEKKLLIREKNDGLSIGDQEDILNYTKLFESERESKAAQEIEKNPDAVVPEKRLSDKDKAIIALWPNIKAGKISVREAAEKLGYKSHSSLLDKIKKFKSIGLIRSRSRKER